MDCNTDSHLQNSYGCKYIIIATILALKQSFTNARVGQVSRYIYYINIIYASQFYRISVCRSLAPCQFTNSIIYHSVFNTGHSTFLSFYSIYCSTNIIINTNKIVYLTCILFINFNRRKYV